MNVVIFILLTIIFILTCYNLKKKLMQNKLVKEENELMEKLNKMPNKQRKDNDEKFYRNIKDYKREFYMVGKEKAYENLLRNLKNDDVIYTKTKLYNHISEIESANIFSYDEKRIIGTVLTMKYLTLDDVIKVYIKMKNKKREKLDSFDVNAINSICKVTNIRVAQRDIKNKIKEYKTNSNNNKKVKNEINNYNGTSINSEVTKGKEVKVNKYKGDNYSFNNAFFQTEDKSNIDALNEPKKGINKNELKNQVIKELEETKNILGKEDIYILMDKFITTNTQRFDDKSMSLEEYMNKIKDFIEFLKCKNLIENTKNIDIMYFNYVLEERKWSIYIENLKSKIKLIEGDSKEDIVSKYVEFYGYNSTDTMNISVLSKVLKLPKQQVLMLVKTKKYKISKEHKMKEFEKELFGDIKVTITDIDKLNGYEFEDFLSSLFKSFGYKVEQTSYSGDYGADLIIEKNDKKIAVQAKNYSGNVGLEAVQQALSGKSYYKCNDALVITNSHFTKQAIQLAESSKVQLIDREKLIQMIEEGAICI